MIYRSLLILAALITLSSNLVIAQSDKEKKPQGLITGIVHDENANAPIEYANVVLYNSSDSSQVTGAVTGKDGVFTINGIRPGDYYVEVHFIGYEKKCIKNISVKPPALSINTGILLIKPSALITKSAIVEGERIPITYNIDKKVIDVSKMGTAASGNAADILENVPSVTVDIQGNVNLRGSSNFTVLIDGRPSVMNNQEILQQSPASSIQSIEIVTNPSAKYDPEGTAGIINIILKKNQNPGLSGIVNGNAGFNDKYGGDFLIQYKTPSINYYIGLDYNRRLFSGNSKSEKRFYTNDYTSFVNSNGNNDEGTNSYGIRGNLEFNLDENNLLNFGGRFGSRKFTRTSSLNYNEWSDINSLQSLYLSKNNINVSGYFYALNMNYLHKFNTPGHELSGEMFLSNNNSDETTISSEINNIIQFSGKKTTESGPSTRIRGKLDYILPLSEKSKFEAGTQGEAELSNDSTGFFEFNPLNNIYEFRDKYSNNIKSNISDLAVYSIYSNEWGKFGFQGGIRTEYTYRSIEINTSDQKFNIDRWDYFPTIHTSFNFSETTQLMANYTRRIDRPGNREIEPFETWMSDKDVRRGNPSLKPQFIDSYELGFKTSAGNISISNEWYYRFTKDRINMIYSVFPGSANTTLTTFQNVGTDYSLGSEVMFNLDPAKFWNVNLMGNLYQYKIEGELDSLSFSKNSFNWNTRMNNIFKLSSSTQLQVNAMYNSPTVSSQEKREGSFSTDLSLRQEFMNKALSLTLQIRDIFRTAKRESSSEGIDFHSYNYFKRESPVVMLNMRLSLNNFKSNNRGLGGLRDSGFDDEGN